MFTAIVILVLIVMLIYAADRRRQAEFERDEFEIHTVGRRLAVEAGVEYDESKPCGHSDCQYPLCIGTYQEKRMPGWYFLNDDPYPERGQ